ARLLHRPALHGVDELDRLFRRAPAVARAAGRLAAARAAALVRRARDLPDAVRKMAGGLLRRKREDVHHLFLARPDGDHLRHLLLQRHAPEEIAHALGDRRARVAVERHGGPGTRRRRGHHHRRDRRTRQPAQRLPAGGGQVHSADSRAATTAPSAIVSTLLLRSTEFGPAMISNSPGSTTSRMSAFHNRKASGPSLKLTVFCSPGSSETRSKPLSSFTGRVTELTRSRT